MLSSLANSSRRVGNEVRWADGVRQFEPVTCKDPVTCKQIDDRWEQHEILLAALGVLTAGALAARAGFTAPATLSTAVATASFCLAVRITRQHNTQWVQKCRYVAAFAYVLWFYKAVETIVPALRNTPRDAMLLHIDEQLFGITPSVPVQAWTTVGLNELM